MEDFTKEAFIHVDVISPHVQEVHFDLMDSGGQIILPSLWSTTIKPGNTVSMHIWPTDKRSVPGPQHHMTPEQRMRFEMGRRRTAAAEATQSGVLRGHHSIE